MSSPPDSRSLATDARNGRAASAEALPTGSLALDLALGTGGWPRGRIVEIFGHEGTGKTTLLLEAIARVQQNGGVGAFIDADHGLDSATAERLGVNVKAMPLLRSNCLEEAFEKIEELLRGKPIEVIALDSIAALLPKGNDTCQDFIPGKNEQHQDRIAHCLKALLRPLARTGAVLLIANQLVEKVGVFYGSPETTPWATMPLRSYASQRVELRRVTQLKAGETVVGAEIKATVVKNRLAAPLARASFHLYFATGIATDSDLLQVGLDDGLLAKKGAWLYYGDVALGNGWDRAREFLRDNAAVAEEITRKILQKRGQPG
jgi:recombination protein RecA